MADGTLARPRPQPVSLWIDAVSDEELKLVIKVAGELRAEVRAWLEKNHPELAKE
jgi:hypothetical protein